MMLTSEGLTPLQDAQLDKTTYVGPCPVPFDEWVESVMAQTIKEVVVTRRSIRKAFEDLVITDAVFNEIGPAINSAASIFFFGFPGNGKTSDRRAHHAADGRRHLHPARRRGERADHQGVRPDRHTRSRRRRTRARDVFLRSYDDERSIRVKRPTIVIGGELTLPMLDLKYNAIGKFYEAPLQMKANGGIFMIDDFGRQQVRAHGPAQPLDRAAGEDATTTCTTVTGTKIEVPFDQLLIFSTNLDPTQAGRRGVPAADQVQDRDPRPDEDQCRQDLGTGVQARRRCEYDDARHRLPDREVVQADQPAVPHVPAARHPRPDDLDRQVQHGAGQLQPRPDRRRVRDLLHQQGEEGLRGEGAIGFVVVCWLHGILM